MYASGEFHPPHPTEHPTPPSCCRAAAGRAANYSLSDQGAFFDLYKRDHDAEGLLFVQPLDPRRVYLNTCAGPDPGTPPLCAVRDCTRAQLQQLVCMHFVLGPQPIEAKRSNMRKVLTTRYGLSLEQLDRELDAQLAPSPPLVSSLFGRA